MTEYQSIGEADMFDMATGQYLPNAVVMASHVFLYRWRRRLLHFTALEDIHDVHNGVMLYGPVQWAFNRAKICIEVNTAGRMIFRLLDHSLYDVGLVDKACELRRELGRDHQPIGKEANLQMTFGDLNGREMQFPDHSTTRPLKQLLGLHSFAAWVEAHHSSPNAEISIPVCHASDAEKTKLPFNMFIEAWRNGDDNPVSEV